MGIVALCVWIVLNIVVYFSWLSQVIDMFSCCRKDYVLIYPALWYDLEFLNDAARIIAVVLYSIICAPGIITHFCTTGLVYGLCCIFRKKENKK